MEISCLVSATTWKLIKSDNTEIVKSIHQQVYKTEKVAFLIVND